MSARRSNIVKIGPRVKAARIRARKNSDVEFRYVLSLVPEPVARAIIYAVMQNSVKPFLELPPKWRRRLVSSYEIVMAQPRETAAVLEFRSPD